MRSSPKSLFLLVWMVHCGAALADSTAESLTKIEAETLVLKARERQLDVQSQIISKQNEIASKQAAAGHLERMTSMATTSDPVVRSIEGVGKALYATLMLNNGATVDATIGDTLPNGMRVVSIQSNAVIVETQKRKRVRLSTSSVSAVPYQAPFPNGMPAVPPPPPVLPPRERMQ